VGLRRHAEERGLAFLSSPFSLEAVDLLRGVGVAAWKIASGEVDNPQLLDAVAQTGQPVLLSSGMSGWTELDRAVKGLKAAGAGPLAVLQCTSAYPVDPGEIGLNVLAEIQRALRLRERTLTPLGNDLPVARRCRAGSTRPRGARHAQPRDVVGKRLRRALRTDEPLREKDTERMA